MKVLVSHPTGNRNVRAIVSAFSQENILGEFNTTLAVDPNAMWLKILPGSVRQELLRRTFPVSADKITEHPLLEISRLVLPKIGLSKYVSHEKGWASVDAVYRSLDQSVAKRVERLAKEKKIDSVYAYEDGAFETFKVAKKLGLKCIYDLPIAYWETGRKLMFEEAERLPEWKSTLGGGISDSQEKLERKVAEIEMSDVIVGPGNFVLDSIPSRLTGKKLIMAPFGSPKTNDKDSAPDHREKESDRPLRVLFAGSMGQRKGLGDLFQAMKLLKGKNVELVVMGSLLAPMEFYRGQFENFTYEPGRPNEEVLKLMRSCDVFCLPSIVEGRALVMQEAMSQGLPVIITPNTGGADLVIEGETGFLVPIRSPQIIAERINWFLENRAELTVMSEKAKQHSANYTWESYGRKIVESLLDS